MQAFALNSTYIPELLNSDFREGKSTNFSISSKEKSLDIRKNNLLVLLKPDNKDLKFSYNGRITNVGEITRIPPTTDEVKRHNKTQTPLTIKYKHNFTLIAGNLLQENNLLSELKYSLTAVDNYNKPEVHFYSQYRKLIKNDYDTIVNGWVYATRTAFGNLVNAIPRKNKLEFMLQAMDKFDTIDFRSISLLEGLDFLYDYINTRILSRGKLLVETNKMIHNKLNDILPVDEIGFFDPSNGESNNLNIQALIFEELFKMEKQVDLRLALDDAIEKNPDIQKHFIKIFEKQTWPIDLKQ